MAQLHAERVDLLERAAADAARPSVLATPMALAQGEPDDGTGGGGDGGGTGGGGGSGSDGSAVLKAAKNTARQSWFGRATARARDKRRSTSASPSASRFRRRSSSESRARANGSTGSNGSPSPSPARSAGGGAEEGGRGDDDVGPSGSGFEPLASVGSLERMGSSEDVAALSALVRMGLEPIPTHASVANSLYKGSGLVYRVICRTYRAQTSIIVCRDT